MTCISGQTILSTVIRLVLVTGIIFNLTLQGEVTQIFYHTYSYSNFYFLTYASQSALMISFPIFFLVKKLSHYFSIVVLKPSGKTKPTNEEEDGEGSSVEQVASPEEEDDEIFTSNFIQFFSCEYTKVKRIFLGSLFLGAALYVTSYFFYVSTNYVPVSVNFSVAQTTNIFSFILSVLLCVREEQKFMSCKAMLLFISIIGIGIISYFSSDNSDETFPNAEWGVISQLVSCIFLSIYASFYIKFFGDLDSLGDVFLHQSFNGLISFFFFWPPILFFHYVKYEVFEISIPIIIFIMVSAIINLVYFLNLTLAFACISSPVYIGMSIQISICLSLLIDVVFRDLWIYQMNYVGMLFVVFSNVSINLLYLLPSKWSNAEFSICTKPFKRTKRKDIKILQEELEDENIVSDSTELKDVDLENL